MEIFVALSIVVLLLLLAQNKVNPAILFFGLVLMYYVFNLIEIKSMLNNFTNTSLVTLLLLLIVSIVIEKTTFISTISNKIFSKSYNKSLLKMSFFVSFFSAFLNNTAVVASMISVIQQNKFHAPSKLLLPLSYAAIFGGTITLVGTSTNLIVNGFVIERGLEPLNLFDFIYVGIPIAIFGGMTLLFVARFLPEIKNEAEKREYFIEAKVATTSKMIGKSILENKLRNLEHLFLNEVIRDNYNISPVDPSEILQADDILIFSGDVKQIEILNHFDGLILEHNKHEAKNLVEVIVSHESNLINQRVKESNFRTKFDASIVSIKRGNEKLSTSIGNIVLEMGDNLILAVGKAFYKRDNLKKNFYILGDIGIQKKLSFFQSMLVVVSFLLVLLLSLLNILTLIKGLFMLLAFYLIIGFLNLQEIKRRFPYDLVIIIGSALGIASVMIDSGVANTLANFLNSSFGSFGVYGSFISIYLLTFLLTEIITNNAAAALSFPIAYVTATNLGVDITPFIFAVAYGASASFMTPYGYQTNLMVSSIGGYSFKIFLKSGILVSIVYSLIAIILIPIVFPF
ncbi:MAG: SLC13 family permease [Epsilonproteobacteria bacterium]|nr:SLC13 family permease [Campylobacterota bacterium]OIO14769.1 MAG: SLC13 family permease [Helicobacteraceae bacterium CG1_02_36_14]PIP09278.1 MAG: SLC13 family permease [Sulfurimonas sp. CG23_combo_of_CG06-09_8_20_14_all_36_33]PIS25752.1 MAG: SLC13 family permease [Sulfurimonas sp. CG08_land_8_20_14_0_20_36_33]PIU34600.1 MAG: SLC13 family permease [Sulfurimonas sp. CG07_land_8_20_14_0_80_36_56]PIV04809.1 MAG: SLC13 family permease [Sulfurimonas sp. CG03_land_8_20_14_0_80_36_25]PIV36290.1 MA